MRLFENFLPIILRVQTCANSMWDLRRMNVCLMAGRPCIYTPLQAPEQSWSCSQWNFTSAGQARLANMKTHSLMHSVVGSYAIVTLNLLISKHRQHNFIFGNLYSNTFRPYRIGDVALLIVTTWIINFGRWSFIYYLEFISGSVDVELISFSCFLAAITKSAQIPFSS
jgi:hypothetical protein